MWPTVDGFHTSPVRSGHRGVVIPQSHANTFDFARLERSVRALADAHARLVTENAALRGEIDDKERRIRALDAALLRANQRRQDVGKRIDELIAQIDQVDAQFESEPKGV